jgi:hypothetical protein
MKITKTNPFNGDINTMDLDVTYEQVESYFEGKLLVQDAFPNLSAGDREFIKTGITEEYWENNILPLGEYVIRG